MLEAAAGRAVAVLRGGRIFKIASHCRLLWSDLEAIRPPRMEWGAEEVEPPGASGFRCAPNWKSEGLIRRSPRLPAGLAGRLVRRGAALGAGRRLPFSCYWSVRCLAFERTFPSSVASTAASRGVTLAVRAPMPLTADLGQTLDGDMKRVMASLPERNPSLATSLQQNLGIVDNLIAAV